MLPEENMYKNLHETETRNSSKPFSPKRSLFTVVSYKIVESSFI